MSNFLVYSYLPWQDLENNSVKATIQISVNIGEETKIIKTSEVNVSGMNQNKTRKHWRERERSEWVKWTTDWFVLK